MIRPRLINVRDLVPEISNRSYATHGIDKYPAKMVPHLARYAIKEVSKVGELVFDPFCGCGTVLVESCLLGRRSVGIDVNPVAVLLARAKSVTFNVDKFIESALAVVVAAKRMSVVPRMPEPRWLPFWFTTGTLNKLRKLRCAIGKAAVSARFRSLLRTCLILAVRRCSLADPRSPKPFISRRSRELRKGRHFDSFRIFADVAVQLCKSVKEYSNALSDPPAIARVSAGDARKATGNQVERVDAVVTSPPYLSAQDYYRSSKLELAVSGLWKPNIERGLGKRIIGSGRGGILQRKSCKARLRRPDSGISVPKLSARSAAVVQDYLFDMRLMLASVFQCLRTGGKCCLVIGDSTVEGCYLPVHQWFLKLARGAGFRLFRHEIDLIRDRRVPPKREGHASVIDREHLLFLEKPERRRGVRLVVKPSPGLAMARKRSKPSSRIERRAATVGAPRIGGRCGTKSGRRHSL